MTALPRWGVCATLRAPVGQVLAFAAHHLGLGAARVWLHFDDPDDPAADAAAGLRGVAVVRCDGAYWRALCGRRPALHQQRQMRNIGRICARTRLDFVLHIDADEFLVADRPVAECLADLDPERPILRVEPWEALHDPALPPGPLSARHFRRALPAGAAAAAIGRYAALLPQGMLSHTVGKCFFRAKVPGLVPSIHGARIEGERAPGGRFHHDLALLHFHAPDPAAWKAALPFRLTKGAYQFNPALQAHLAAADEAEIDAFYHAVQTARPALLDLLRAADALRETDLCLDAAVRAAAVRPPAPRPGAGPR